MAEARDGGDIDWRLTAWEGARREPLRRWEELPLERVPLAQEEMADPLNRDCRLREAGA
jgi:hypothetical protein